MNEDSFWQPHLKPGEHIVWTESFSPAVRKAERARIRRSTAFFAVVSGGLAVLAGYRFYEAVFAGTGQANLTSAVAAPLFFVFGIALAILSFFLFRKLNLAPPGADHYAITSRRLLALSGAGAIFDEMPGADIAGVIFDSDRKPTELHVLRRNSEDKLFFIEHLPDLRAVKARIQQQFPIAEEAAP